MENYETLGILGEGTYGTVIKARHRLTGRIVAIKKFKQTNADEHVRKTSMRELKLLKQLQHPNIVRLLEAFRHDGRLFLVFEYVENTILQLLERTSTGLPSHAVQRYMYQLLRAVEFCHSNNVIHRDVKPENILIARNGLLKLCDFGFARTMINFNEVNNTTNCSNSSSKSKYTDYVATRWYRAPELLVGEVRYDRAVDVWAIGCIFAELSDTRPLFPGESDLHQLSLVMRTCGALPPTMIYTFRHNHLYRRVSFPQIAIHKTLEQRFPKRSKEWLQFLTSCLQTDPKKRLTCEELMNLPYFTSNNFRRDYEDELKAIIAEAENVPPLIPVSKRSSNTNYIAAFNNDNNTNIINNNKEITKLTKLSIKPSQNNFLSTLTNMGSSSTNIEKENVDVNKNSKNDVSTSNQLLQNSTSNSNNTKKSKKKNSLEMSNSIALTTPKAKKKQVANGKLKDESVLTENPTSSTNIFTSTHETNKNNDKNKENKCNEPNQLIDKLKDSSLYEMNGYTTHKPNKRLSDQDEPNNLKTSMASKPLNVSGTTTSTLFDSLQVQRGSEIHDSQWSSQFSLSKSHKGYDGLDEVVINPDEVNGNASVLSSQSTSMFNLPSPFRTKQVLQNKKQQELQQEQQQSQIKEEPHEEYEIAPLLQEKELEHESPLRLPQAELKNYHDGVKNGKRVLLEDNKHLPELQSIHLSMSYEELKEHPQQLPPTCNTKEVANKVNPLNDKSLVNEISDSHIANLFTLQQNNNSSTTTFEQAFPELLQPKWGVVHTTGRHKKNSLTSITVSSINDNSGINSSINTNTNGIMPPTLGLFNLSHKYSLPVTHQLGDECNEHKESHEQIRKIEKTVSPHHHQQQSPSLTQINKRYSNPAPELAFLYPKQTSESFNTSINTSNNVNPSLPLLSPLASKNSVNTKRLSLRANVNGTIDHSDNISMKKSNNNEEALNDTVPRNEVVTARYVETPLEVPHNNNNNNNNTEAQLPIEESMPSTTTDNNSETINNNLNKDKAVSKSKISPVDEDYITTHLHHEELENKPQNHSQLQHEYGPYGYDNIKWNESEHINGIPEIGNDYEEYRKYLNSSKKEHIPELGNTKVYTSSEMESVINTKEKQAQNICTTTSPVIAESKLRVKNLTTPEYRKGNTTFMTSSINNKTNGVASKPTNTAVVISNRNKSANKTDKTMAALEALNALKEHAYQHDGINKIHNISPLCAGVMNAHELETNTNTINLNGSIRRIRNKTNSVNYNISPYNSNTNQTTAKSENKRLTSSKASAQASWLKASLAKRRNLKLEKKETNQLHVESNANVPHAQKMEFTVGPTHEGKELIISSPAHIVNINSNQSNNSSNTVSSITSPFISGSLNDNNNGNTVYRENTIKVTNVLHSPQSPSHSQIQLTQNRNNLTNRLNKLQLENVSRQHNDNNNNNNNNGTIKNITKSYGNNYYYGVNSNNSTMSNNSNNNNVSNTLHGDNYISNKSCGVAESKAISTFKPFVNGRLTINKASQLQQFSNV